MPATLAERFVFGTADPRPVTSVHIIPRITTALIGRFALAAIFLVAGFEKLADTTNTVAQMTAAGVPAAGVVVYVAAFVEILGALSLALGLFARLGAAMLAGFLVVTTFVFHAFWNYEDAERGRQLVNFLKNVAIAGGLFMIVANGPGRASVDARLRRSLVTLVIGVLALAGCRRDSAPMPTTPRAEPVVQTAAPDPTRLARGEYVVALAGCKVCHDAIKGPNLTPDRATGLGAWSDTEIITAMRRGLRRDGTTLPPMMPSSYFHQMTDSDARAVVTYLRTLRPVVRAVEGSKVSIAPIDLLEPVDNVDPIDDARSHGEYLANLMHCGACHTARGGAHADQLFAGGVVMPISENESVISANITNDPDTGLGQWTAHDIIVAVRTGKMPSNHDIEGPMRAYTDGWSRLDDRDASALAEYIKSVPGISNEIHARPLAVSGPVTLAAY